MWQVYYCNAPPPGVSQIYKWRPPVTCEWRETPSLEMGDLLKFVRMALSSCFRVWIIFTSQLTAYISVSSPCCITLARPWAFDIVVFVTTVIFCSRCPPPAALLPISPVLISVSTPQLFCLRLNNTLLQHTVLNTAHSQISLLQMESGCFSVLLAGTVPALAASLAVVAVFQLAGALLACCLARYWSLQRIYPHHLLYPGWLPPRRGNGMSLVTTDRRGCSGEHCHEAWPIWTVLWSNISIRGKFEISQKGGCWTQCVTTACSPAPSTHSAVLTFPTHYFATIVLWIEYTEVAILLLLLHWKMQSILIKVML